MAYDLKYDALLRAIQVGDQSEATALFENKLYDVNQAIDYLFEDGKMFTITPLYWAVRHDCPEVCKYLLAKRANPYPDMVYEYYPLHEACNRGYDKVVQEFVNAKCDLNRVNADQDSPLHVACMRGHIQCVHILLRAKADCSLKNKLGHTPLQSAVYHNRNDLVELFTAHNQAPTPTHKTKSTRTATTSTGSAPNPAPHHHHPSRNPASQALTAGVPVQRRHSFNAPTNLSRIQTSAQHRVRSSSRPQSYNGLDKPALMTGQHIPTSVAMPGQSLASSGSSFQSFGQNFHSPHSFSTLSTEVSLPDSPVERDAPELMSKNSRGITGVVGVGGEMCCGSQLSKKDDVRSKFSSLPSSTAVQGGGELVLSQTSLFPSPGGVMKETGEKMSVSKPLHPLTASQKSYSHRHGDRHLHERMSHPEFHVSKRDVHVTNRAKSFNDVFHSNTTSGKKAPVHLSASRERINSLSSTLCDTLVFNPTPQHHHGSKPPLNLHPLLHSMRSSLATLAHQFGLSPDHLKSLNDLTLCPSPPTSSYSTPDPSLCPSLSFEEVEYDIVEGPLEAKVWREEGGRETYAMLQYKVQLRDALVQLRSQMHQGDIVLLKVRVQVEPCSEESPQPPVSLVMDMLPEAAILQQIPPHPNVVSVLYHCRGSVERFKQHLLQLKSQSHATTCSGSHSGTSEPQYGTETRTYIPALSGDLLFQSLPGTSIAKFFTDFLRWYKSDIEERFLHILIQILLAVAHLRKNFVSHCAIGPQNIYVSDGGHKVMLGDFSQAISLRPKNLEILRTSIRKLKGSKTRSLSPEAEKSLFAAEAEGVYPVSNLESTFATSDSYAVGALFYDLFLGKMNTLSSSQPTPFIHSLSFKCNHLLQRLVARDPTERFSALQGAISCFVLLYGPRTSDMINMNDCLRWLVSESLEVYLNPVLRDSALLSDSDSYQRRLHYTYLSIASPELIWNSCKFFNDY